MAEQRSAEERMRLGQDVSDAEVGQRWQDQLAALDERIARLVEQAASLDATHRPEPGLGY